MEMEFIDTHSHLYDEAFLDDADAAVARSVEAGVCRIILPDIDSTERDAMHALASRHPGVLYTCSGLHPTSVGTGWKEELEKVLSGNHQDICAIGEIGLDFYWSKEFVTEQETVLKEQLRLAHTLSLPVIIHSRESTEAIIRIIRECREYEPHGVFHAFSGSLETYRELQKLGDWYIGIGGVLTYRKASIAETVKDIPLERIVLETDSPYLTPVPCRGRRNESAYIPHIAEKLAELKGISMEEIAEVTTSNARNLFRI